jgi:carbon storage regulator CsrA
MLVLARKTGDKVHIPLPDGREVIVTVVEIHVGRVRLGFDAPRDVPIHRAENIEEGLRGK